MRDSPESCNDGIDPASSLEKMISVRTCYCKKEGNAILKKNNDTNVHNENRYPAIVVSKTPVIKNKTCESNADSAERARNITDKEMVKWSTKAQPSDPILSPETSTALENAEKIINNAKIQLVEVYAMSNLDSARQNRNTYSNDLPLDDEAEELLYIRELVSSKFYEASSTRSEADDKTSARPDDSSRITVRTVDLSAAKFRMSRRRQRRRVDWSSLGSDDRSDGRVSLAVAPSRETTSSSSSSPKISNTNETTTRDDCPQASSASELVRARENACGIQIGPSVHIVDRELTRQDLDDVHISPDVSWTRCRSTNIATYSLRHGAVESATFANEGDEPEISTRVPMRTIRGKLDTPRSEKHARIIVPEIAVENGARIENSDFVRDNVRTIESAKLRVQYHVGDEKSEDRVSDPRHVEDARVFECAKSATNQGAINPAVIKNSGIDNEMSRNEPKDQKQVKIDCTNNRYVEDDKIFNETSNVDDRIHLRNEDTANKVREYDRNDRSRRPSADDASRKTGFSRCENIASRHRATESSRSHRTINEHFSNTFDSHNGQDKLRIVVDEDTHRSFTSSCSDGSRAEDDTCEVDLYRPCLDDLDSILLSNDKKLERVARATKNFAQLLSKPEFLRYKLDEAKGIPRRASRKEFSSFDKDKSACSSTLEIELRNEDLTVADSELHRADVNSHEKFADATETRSSDFATKNDSRGYYAKNSVESSVFPVSVTSDKAPRIHLSGSLTDKSDFTTLSNVVPALSSTRTESYRRRDEPIITPQVDRRADVKSCDARTNVSANKFLAREIDPDDVLARLPPRDPGDTSEIANRFVDYILQDGKANIEDKVASVLKKSTIAPTAVQMFLDRLREAESTRNARQTETLDILRSIFVNVTSRIDQGIDEDMTRDDKKMEEIHASQNATDGSIPREENAQQTLAEINEQIEKNCRFKNPDEYSSDFSEIQEINEDVLSATRSESTKNSKNDSKSKRNAHQTESVRIAEGILIDIKKHTDENVNEDVKNDKGISDFLIGTNASNAIGKPILQKEIKDNVNNIRQIVRKSCDFKNSDKHIVDSSFRETRENVRSTAHPESGQSFKNNSNSEAESLKQISDIHSDDDKNVGKSSRHSSVKSNEGSKIRTLISEADNPNANIAISENKMDNVKNDKNDAEISREDIKEITNNITTASKNASPVSSKISEIKDERVGSDAKLSIGSKFTGEVLIKENVTLVHTSAKEDIESSLAIGKDLVTKEKISPENSLRDRASLSSAKNGKSLKEIASRNKQTFLNIAQDDSAKKIRSDEIRVASMTIAADGNRDGDENENSESRKNAKIDEQRNTSQKRRIDILSDSNSSINSTLLDDRSTNDAFSLNIKRIGTSSETSHSEGELYMPSSCSYSLGEVRVLRRDLIENDTMDRDSSVTILVTRSMLTSLNDSTTSLLESSGHI